jgi:hypothetical protein
MERRSFLASSLAMSAIATGSPIRSLEGLPARATDNKGRDFYHLRRYHLASGPQVKLCNDFLRDALVPALNRLGISPVGIFTVSIGAQSPSIYVLMPHASIETLAMIETDLAKDAEYVKTGAAFLNTPANAPAFDRMESSMMQAFEKMPNLVLPAATAAKGPRVFELRTYEGATDQDHKRKVEMMQSGEGEIFAKLGFEQVFYGDALIGPRLPNLSYMLCFESLADREKKWASFTGSADWKAYSTLPKYAFEPIVSNITNVILLPAPYSQI